MKFTGLWETALVKVGQLPGGFPQPGNFLPPFRHTLNFKRPKSSDSVLSISPKSPIFTPTTPQTPTGEERPDYIYRYNNKRVEEVSGLLDFGARRYEPTIGRFTGVDPIAEEFAWVSPYNYVENRVPNGIDLWGLQYSDFNGNPEGPIDPLSTSNGAVEDYDVNGNGTQDYYLPEVTVMATRLENQITEQIGEAPDKNSILPNEVVEYGRGVSQVGETTAALGVVSDGTGGLGAGLNTLGGSVRFTNGGYNGNILSLKYYKSGWTGGSRARITTYQLGKAGTVIGKVGTVGTIAIGAYDIGANAYHEGGFGTHTQQATGRAVGSLVGGWAGAETGAAIGAWFWGFGAIPGGIIGGIVGGHLGSKGGEGVVKEIQKR